MKMNQPILSRLNVPVDIQDLKSITFIKHTSLLNLLNRVNGGTTLKNDNHHFIYYSTCRNVGKLVKYFAHNVASCFSLSM